MADGPAPRHKILVRGTDGATIYITGEEGPRTVVPSKLQNVPCNGAQLSADGALLALYGDGVSVYDMNTEQKVIDLPGAGPQAVAFSPKGTYLQVFFKSSGAEGEKNLVMFELPSGRAVFSLSQKTFLREKWPTLMWTADESACARVVTNEVQFYAPADFASGQARRLRIPNVASACVSPGPSPKVAVFLPESKGQPASIRIHSLPACAPGEVEESQPLARRSFFRANAARFLWNEPGTAVLALATADVDKTNQSYYGESSLHFLRVDGSVEGAVPLSKEGPVHDVQWSPTGKEFYAVYGFMPAKATLFNDALKPLYELAAGPYNVVRWNPFGRFLCRAGFGNLPGDVEFLDRKADAKCKQITETRMANSVAIDWSPCGRYVLSSTTAPRLQVDNGFAVTKYTGERLFTHQCKAPQQVYQVEWWPARAGAFPDRPQTPGAAAQAKEAKDSGIVKKAAPYRPPSAAARGAGPAQATFSLAREAGATGSGSRPQAYKPPSAAAPAARLPPGAEPVETKTASKNAKKRANAKAKKAADGVAGLSVGDD